MAAAVILKIKKSPNLGRDSSDLVEIWHSEAVRPWHVRPLKIQIFLKIVDNGSRLFEKAKNCDILIAVRAISTKFGTMT